MKNKIVFDLCRNGELNLSINSFSFFKPESSVTISHPGRKYSPITDLYQPNFKPAYNEFDTVGIVSSITDAPRVIILLFHFKCQNNKTKL